MIYIFPIPYLTISDHLLRSVMFLTKIVFRSMPFIYALMLLCEF